MDQTPPDNSIEQAAEWIAEAQRVIVLSGAGLSKASGIPTYRDAGGLWRTEENLKFSHIDGFRADPEGFNKFWGKKIATFAAAKPNFGHTALARLQTLKPTTHATQNVDGLLQDAGCSGVLELHGNLRRFRCSACRRVPEVQDSRLCSHCGKPNRPDVVLFGELLDRKTEDAALLAATHASVVLVIGTTAEVYPAARIPYLAHEYGAWVVVIDVEPSENLLGYADCVLKGPAELVLPRLIEQVDVRLPKAALENQQAEGRPSVLKNIFGFGRNI